MKSYVIIGANYGDEGKGLMTDYICSQVHNPLVIRFNGGAQAAHTVIRDGVRHVFSSYGSGSLAGAPTFLSKFVLVDPVAAVAEFRELFDKIPYAFPPTLYIDDRCRIVTPADIYYNHQAEAKNGHGSCGMGIFATTQRSEKVQLQFSDLFRSEEWLHKRCQEIIDHYDFEGYEKRWEDFFVAVENLKYIANSASLSQFHGHTFVFEGAQGLLLDEEYGVMPHCTPSNTGLKNVAELLNNIDSEVEVIYVSRCYLTRHGHGPLENECDPHEIGKHVGDQTNVYNEFQKHLRYAPLDVKQLLDRIETDAKYMPKAKVSVALTCRDQMETLPFALASFNEYEKLYISRGPAAKDVKLNNILACIGE